VTVSGLENEVVLNIGGLSSLSCFSTIVVLCTGKAKKDGAER
jgi:hypothetical protein